MTTNEWNELKGLGSGEQNKERFDELIAMTEKENEHPEEYDGACLCKECRSYGD